MTSHTESPISIEALKRHAKRLQKEIKKNNPIFKLSEAQDLLARTFGLNNWHEMNETAIKNNQTSKLKKHLYECCEVGGSILPILKENNTIRFDIKKALHIAAKNRHLHIVKELLEEYLPYHPEIKLYQHDIISCYLIACKRGYLEMVQYLLQDYYQGNATLLAGNRVIGLIDSCRHGHYLLVKYLLEESHFKTILNNQETIDKAFLQTAFFENVEGVFGNKHFQIIQYLLTSKDIPYRANINIKNSECLKIMCFDKPIIEYFLTSPELKEHADIYNDSGKIFEFIYQKAEEWQYYEVVDYLMNDYKIERTPEIMQVINKYGSIRDNRSNQDMKCIINC